MSAEEQSDQLVDIGGYHLAIRCKGHGTPTVVLDAGLGEGINAWSDIQSAVATFTQVCAYDRAGVGQSIQGPPPRTSQHMVAELRVLLRNSHIEKPYILVGHSLGGLNAQLFAMQYPHDVAGLVLVDPSFPDMLARFAEVIPEDWQPFWNSLFQSDAEGMTLADFAASCTQVATGTLPDIPLMILSAGQPVKLPPEYSAFPAADVLRVMRGSHAAMARASSKGQHVIAESSTHATMLLQTAMIVDAIRAIVDAVR